jgi:transposase
MDRIVVRLSKRVKRRLQKRMRRTREARLRQRYQIVLLWAQGWSSRQMAEALGCAASTALRWGHRFAAEGEAGLIDRRRENGRPKVDLDLLQAVGEIIEGAPTESGWQRSTWTRELVALELEKRTGERLSVATVGRMLHRLGARWGVPRPVVRCPWSKAAKARRMGQVRRLLRRLPADQVAVYQDEVEIHLNPKIGRHWMLRGRQTEVVTPGQNQKRHLAGTLDAKTGKLVWVWGEHRDSALFIDLLRALVDAYPQAEKIQVLLDNGAAHDSQATRKALQTEKLQPIVLHFLPPYCPFENRIERLWKELHANVTRNHTCPSMDILAQRVDHFLTAAAPWPRSHPSTATAAEVRQAA